MFATCPNEFVAEWLCKAANELEENDKALKILQDTKVDLENRVKG